MILQRKWRDALSPVIAAFNAPDKAVGRKPMSSDEEDSMAAF
jgi:hypothetical protein